MWSNRNKNQLLITKAFKTQEVIARPLSNAIMPMQ
jgi:hypothetical protein